MNFRAGYNFYRKVLGHTRWESFKLQLLDTRLMIHFFG